MSVLRVAPTDEDRLVIRQQLLRVVYSAAGRPGDLPLALRNASGDYLELPSAQAEAARDLRYGTSLECQR